MSAIDTAVSARGAKEEVDQGATIRAVPSGPRCAGPTRWLGVLLPLCALVTLEVAVRIGAIPAHLLPPPSAIARTLEELANQGLAKHVIASALRVALGFSLGALFAIGCGALVGLSARAEALLELTFQGLRAIPSLARVPLLLLWLGIDEAAKVVLIAIGAFFPVYMGVASGFRDVDRKLLEVAEMAGLSRIATVRRVLMPAALPAIMTGLRNGLSLAWMFMVAAELIAATRGLGFLLNDGRETGRADIVVAAILLLALLGKLTDTGMALLERYLLSWRDTRGTRA